MFQFVGLSRFHYRPSPVCREAAANGRQRFIKRTRHFGFSVSVYMASPELSIPFALFPAIGALAVYVILVLARRSRSLPLPPGPRPDPLLGNVRQMGSNDLKILFEQWGKEHGGRDFGLMIGYNSSHISSQVLSSTPPSSENLS